MEGVFFPRNLFRASPVTDAHLSGFLQGSLRPQSAFCIFISDLARYARGQSSISSTVIEFLFC